MEQDEAEHPAEPSARRRRLTSLRGGVSRFARRRPLVTGAILLVVAVLALTIGDVGLMAARLERIDVDMPRATAGSPQEETWLIVGTDSRDALPDGPNRYGSEQESGEGSRADVLALVRPSADGVTVLVLPRDLTLGRSFFELERLATSYLASPQDTVDLLCTQLGVPVSHLVSVDMAEFATIIDSLGGLEVTLDEPFRDTNAGLDIQQAGTQTLSGIDALALVRSRHPEVLRDGEWVALSDSEGAQHRSRDTGIVMKALMTALRDRASTPSGAQRLAWTLSGNLGVDEDTGPIDLFSLSRAVSATEDDAVTVVDVPAPIRGSGFVAMPTDETYSVMAEHSYQRGDCEPAD